MSNLALAIAPLSLQLLSGVVTPQGEKPDWLALARASRLIVTGVVEEKRYVERTDLRRGPAHLQSDGLIVHGIVSPAEYVLGRLHRIRVSAVHKGHDLAAAGAIVEVFREGSPYALHVYEHLPIGETVLAFLVHPIAAPERRGALSVPENTVISDLGPSRDVEEPFDFGRAFGLVSQIGRVVVRGPETADLIEEALAEIAATGGGIANRPPMVRVRLERRSPDEVDFLADATDPDGDEMSFNWSGCGRSRTRISTCRLRSDSTVLEATVTVIDSRGDAAAATALLDSARPALAVLPWKVPFGNVKAGSHAEFPLIVTNVGGGTLSGSATVSGRDFRLLGQSTYTLGPGEQIALTVQCAPTAEGVVNGVLHLTGAEGESVPMTATGVLSSEGFR